VTDGLDILVNNAGVGYSMPVLDLDIGRAKALYDTNVWGPVRMVQSFSEPLIAKRGRVVNISSAGAWVNTPWIGMLPCISFHFGIFFYLANIFDLA
jgi:NAD(P)-dependent dehydrogenase (short-subunit alcohol dehydrogenase family)